MSRAQQAELFWEHIKLLRKSIVNGSGAIVSIDPARGRPGLCVCNPITNEYKLYTFETKTKGFAKVIEVERWLKEILKQINIRFFTIEDYAYASKFGREGAGEVGGVLRRYAMYRKVPMVPISVQTLKAFVGVSAKELIIKEVLKQYGVDCNYSDEADAFLLAKIGHLLYTMLIETFEVTQEQSIKLFRKPHDFCSLSLKNGTTIKNLIVKQGEGAHGFTIGLEEIQKAERKRKEVSCKSYKFENTSSISKKRKEKKKAKEV